MKSTESISDRFKKFHFLTDKEQTEELISDYDSIVSSLQTSKKSIVKAMHLISQVYEAGGNIIMSGAGTSGRLGILKSIDAQVFPGVKPHRISYLMAGGKDALFQTGEGAEDLFNNGYNDARQIITSNDLLIATSASGTAQYVLGSMALAREMNAHIIGMTCNESTPVNVASTHSIVTKTGAEFPHGGTRKKAGHAQKMLMDVLFAGLFEESNQISQLEKQNLLFDKMCAHYASIPAVVRNQEKEITKATNLLTKVYEAGGNIVFMGAGQAGKLGIIQSSECASTFNTPSNRIKAYLAKGEQSMFRYNFERDSSTQEGIETCLSEVSQKDVLVTLSTNHDSPYVLGAIQSAKQRNISTISLIARSEEHNNQSNITITTPTYNPFNPFSNEDLAQKMVLDTLTTHVHEKLGRIYEGEMVCFKGWLSQKLRKRSQRVVSRIGKVTPIYAEALLKATGFHIPEAIVMARKRYTLLQAQDALKSVDYNLHKIL